MEGAGAGARSSTGSKGLSPDKEIAVMGDEDTVLGFGLVGIKHLIVIHEEQDEKEIMSIVRDLIEKPEIGFILITQKTAERIRTDLEKLKLQKSLYPIFIEIPDKHGELPDREDPIKNLIRRAIGMEVIKN